MGEKNQTRKGDKNPKGKINPNLKSIGNSATKRQLHKNLT